MAYGKRDGFSYLDGMPVKISEAVRAPRKVVLPVHFHPSLPTELLTEEYDFTLERQVLADAERRRQAKERLQKARVEKVASDIQTFSQNNPLTEKHSVDSESFIQGMANEECKENVHAETQQQPWQTTDILTPQPLASKDSTASDPVLQPKGLNLADFENETSPFDYMELQTINDLEELSTVFQGISINTHDGRRVPRSQVPFLATHELPAAQNNSQLNLDKFSAVVDVKNGQVSFSSPAYSLPTVNKANFANGPKEDLSYLSNGYSFQPKVLYNLGSRSTESAVAELDGKTNHDFQKMRSAKSFPDIPTEVEAAASDHALRSHTPPPVPYFSLFASIPRKSNGSFDHQHNYSTCNPSASISSLQEDNLELNHEQQALVSSIADMGFSRCRVARAVNHLGTDDKKVIDYLCLVQSLEDVGYDGYETEIALQLHNNDTNEAKSFLDLLRQFQDLGFDKDTARKALVLHKNDRDKALDSLLT